MCNSELTFMDELGPHGRYVDACMEDIIRLLRKNGTETIASCCGHGVYPRTIVYRARNGNAIEYYTRTTLLDKKGNPKKRKFYAKDAMGIYHIPEVVNAP